MARMSVVLLFVAAATIVTPVLADGPPRIFVASTGDDANDGSRASPKRSFQAAHDAVAAGGDVVALDTAGYGALTITKSVSVAVPPGVTGFVTVTTNKANGVTIDAGASDIVTLRGLTIEGPGNFMPAGYGIFAKSIGTLVVEDTNVKRFDAGIVSFGNGSKIVVRRGSVRNTNIAINIGVGGIYDKASGVVSDMELTGNYIAFYTSSNYPVSSAVRLLVSSSIISGGTHGFLASGYTEIVADNCIVTGNSIAFYHATQSIIYSRGNNTVYNNEQLGDTPMPLPAQ